MKFLLDSCISSFAVQALRENGVNVTWIPETGKDPGDEIILKKAYEEDWVLVTADKDFGELVFLKKMAAASIVRLVNIPAKLQGETLLKVIREYEDEITKGVIITVDRYRVRIRYMYV